MPRFYACRNAGVRHAGPVDDDVVCFDFLDGDR